MKKKPLISICVANYNGKDVIRPCLESIYRQKTECEIETIIHDDASTDNSVSIISSEFPEATLIESSNNIGFCASNNRMVNSAQGEFILLLNNDAWLCDDAIQAFYDAHCKYGDAIFTLPQHEADNGKLIDCGMFMDIFANPIAQKEIKEGPVAMVMGACLWIPKKLWKLCGGFPEWFDSMAEDMYLCNKARLMNYPVIALKDSGYFHHVGYSFGGGKVKNSELTTTFKRRIKSERNKTFVIMILYPSIAAWAILPIHLTVLITEGLLLSLIKRNINIFQLIYWPTILSISNYWPTLLKSRKTDQKQRKVSLRNFFSVYKFTYFKLQMLLKYGIPKIN